jgi:hypothetical protein
MSRDCEFEGVEEVARLQESFGQISDEIETVASEGARNERVLLEKEMDEIGSIQTEVKKFTSDTQLKALSAQARFEAFEKQIAILKRNGTARDMAEAIAEEARERDQMDGKMQDALRKLREIDRMLGGDDADLHLDARFQSIQERIAAVLEDVDSATLRAREQELKARLHELKVAKR